MIGGTNPTLETTISPTPSPLIGTLSPTVNRAPVVSLTSTGPTNDDPLIGESNPPHERNISCERSSNVSWCTDVGNSFENLKTIIENKAGTILFCEFDVEMAADDNFIFVTSDIEMICQTPHKCRIRGSGRHLAIKGSSAKVFVQGFVFKGSTVGAVNVQEGASHVQSFCNSVFDSNAGRTRGLGIRTERNTITEISHCRFLQNESTDMGGGVFNRGTMLIESTDFIGNIGRGAW